MAVMGTAKILALGHVHPFTGVRDVSPGTAVMGGTQVESPGKAATLVILNTDTGAQRAETRTSEVTHGNQHTGDC